MDKERGQSYNEHKHLYKNFITNIDKDMEHAVVRCEIKQGGKHAEKIFHVGFSIKSEVGNAQTLLNAGKTTNFIYKVIGITTQQINAIDTSTKTE